MKCALVLALLPTVIIPALAQESGHQFIGAGTPPKIEVGQAGTDLSPSQIFSRARSSVVVIVADDQNGQREALGSGFIVSHDRIATNHHVVEGMSEAYVVFSDGDVKPVSKVVADSEQQDVIILMTETGNRPSLALGDELSLQQGDPVYALGAPKGLQLSFTSGIVSSFRKPNGQFLIQTTAPIAPGSSGGPLFDHTGRVVGVTTSLLADAPGIYFSVGIGDVRRLLRTPRAVSLPLDEWAKQQGKKSDSDSSHSIASNEDQSGQTPSLQETISWMSSFLEAHGQEWLQAVVIGSQSIDPSQSNFMRLPAQEQYVAAFLAFFRAKAAVGPKECAVVIRHNYATPIQLHTDMKAPTRMSVEFIFLGDIDTASVKVSGSHVYFETTNNLDRIGELVPANDGTEKVLEYDSDRSWIVLDSAENAKRFADALKHAVTLCGGITTPF